MAPVIENAPKEAKPKKTTGAPKKPRTYPSYFEMVCEAITTLKERTGSSQIAITKFIEEKQKTANLPINFKKLLLIQLKKFVANGKLVKVKNSFKLPSKSATTGTDKKSKTPSAKTAAQKPKSSTAAKKTKTAPAKEGAKKTKTVTTAATKKSKAADATGTPAKKAKTEGKKTVKAKKPKTIKSPAKKVAAKKAKK